MDGGLVEQSQSQIIYWLGIRVRGWGGRCLKTDLHKGVIRLGTMDGVPPQSFISIMGSYSTPPSMDTGKKRKKKMNYNSLALKHTSHLIPMSTQAEKCS